MPIDRNYAVSDIEKNNLEAHVNMSLQRYYNLEEKVEKLSMMLADLTAKLNKRNDIQIESMTTLKDYHNDEFINIKLELQKYQSDTREYYSTEIKLLRAEFTKQNKDTTKIVVGATATIIVGLLSTIVTLLIAFI